MRFSRQLSVFPCKIDRRYANLGKDFFSAGGRGLDTKYSNLILQPISMMVLYSLAWSGHGWVDLALTYRQWPFLLYSLINL